MERNYKFNRINGISLEQSPISLVLKYSDSDYRETYHYNFRIPVSEFPITLEKSIEKIDFFPEARECSHQKISWADIPEQVIKDALIWLKTNIDQVADSENDKTIPVLTRLKEKIEKWYENQ